MIYRRMIHSAAVCLSLLTCCVFIQPADAADNEAGFWTVFSTTDSLPGYESSPRWHYWFDAQARYFDIGSGTNQWLLRPAIGYEFESGIKAWAGYARFRSRDRVGQVRDENRFWQQVDWRAGDWQGGRVSMRIRLEQRSVETGDDTGVVMRFMTKYVRPSPRYPGRTLIVSLEPFVDFRDTDWGGSSGPAQNRIFIGMGWRVSDKLTVEAGYMNQHIWRDSAEDRTNHLAILTVKAKL